MGIACAVNRNGGHCQNGSSPRAGSEHPHPCGGVGLDMAEDPCGDGRGEENRVDERFRDEMKTPLYLRDGDVAASSTLSAVTLAFLRGDGLSHGGWWWYRFKRHSICKICGWKSHESHQKQWMHVGLASGNCCH